MFYSRMLRESQKLEENIDSLQSQIRKLPEGKLLCVRNGSYQKWFQSNGKTKTYIPKKKKHLAEQLAIKKYLVLRLADLQREKMACDAYLKHHRPKQAEQLLTDTSEYQQLLSPHFLPLSKELLTWSQAPYDHNTRFPEQLTHKTSSGNIVRSKSEAFIDMLLHINKIPFRYECALKLDSVTLYPDFTIRHPKTGQTYYWEHFGLMDDPAYARNAGSKLQLYFTHGIIPAINLITTYETKDHPLTTQVIEENIQNYFL